MPTPFLLFQGPPVPPRRPHVHLRALALALAVAVAMPLAHAGGPADDDVLARIAALEQRLGIAPGEAVEGANLDQRLRIIERKLELQDEAAQAMDAMKQDAMKAEMISKGTGPAVTALGGAATQGMAAQMANSAQGGPTPPGTQGTGTPTGAEPPPQQ